MAISGKPAQLLIFTVGDQRCALYLSEVEEVVRAVQITPLPKAPEIILGMVNLHGQVAPVINVRRRLGMPQREITLASQLVITHTAQRTVALVVDTVTGVIEYSAQDLAGAEYIAPGIEYVQGVVKLKDGLAMIYDLAQFLSLEEEESLTQVMAAL